MGERGELLSGDHLDGQATTFGFFTETGNGHPARRKSDPHGVRKSERRVRADRRIIA
jgi:hypothetical protein